MRSQGCRSSVFKRAIWGLAIVAVAVLPAATEALARGPQEATAAQAENPPEAVAGEEAALQAEEKTVVSTSGNGLGATRTRDRFFFGGGLGLGFGDITYVDVSPMVGYRFHPQVRGGGSLLYRYSKDDRYSPSRSYTDYGGSIFAEYQPLSRVFFHLEYEYLDYEFLRQEGEDLTTDRDSVSSVLGGVGLSTPVGGSGAFNVMALYNFSYDSNDPFSPYSDPWILRVGVAFGF